MNINNILTKQNIAIFKLLNEQEYSIRDLANAAKCSPGKAHSAVKTMLKFEIIKTRKEKNRTIASINFKNPLFRKIKSLVNVFEFTQNKAYKKLSKKGIMGIYGSYAKGEDTNESDVDLWIFTNEQEIEIRQLIRDLERYTGKQINLVMLNKNKLKRIKEKDKEFYIRLKLTSFQLNDEIFE